MANLETPDIRHSTYAASALNGICHAGLTGSPFDQAAGRKRREPMPQIIYESDPMETRGKRGKIAETAFAAGQAILENHPEIECVVLTIVTSDDPSMPSQNAVCFRDSLKDDARANEIAHDAVVGAMTALLKLAKQMDEHGLFGPRKTQG